VTAGGPRPEDLSRSALVAIAAEQAALCRVAELTVEQAPAEVVFAAVAEELSLLLGVHMVRALRFEADGTATVLAARGRATDQVPPGTNIALSGGGVLRRVLETGMPAWIADVAEVHGPIGDRLKTERVRCAAAGPIVVAGRLWGAVLVGAETVEALPAGSEQRLAQFAELVSTAISNIESRGHVERLAAEQSALRRVAVLVAHQATAQDVFAVVTQELSRVVEVEMVRTVRCRPDGDVEILAALGDSSQQRLASGTIATVPPGSVLAEILESATPARREFAAGAPTPAGAMAGARSVAGGPLVVNGRLWGAIVVGSTIARGLPPGTENRVAEFAELLSTSIANIESRAEVQRLVAEQSALRRVAELVARQASPEEVFTLVTDELSSLLGIEVVRTLRFEPDGRATVVAARGRPDDPMPPGTTLEVAPGGMLDELFRTGRPARFENYTQIRGPTGAILRKEGTNCAAGGPIAVAGRLWGAMVAATSNPQALPPGSEDRVAEFAELVSTAISNIESRAELAESRARIVRAGDEVRRRFERDLHDGAQQRLVGLQFELQTIDATVPPQLPDLRRALSSLADGLNEVLDNLRELSRGMHPAVLTEGGLTPALRSLARRSAVPVDVRIELAGDRFEEAVEVAAYYVVSEALTNTAKHADASHIYLSVLREPASLALSVADDGRGGASASSGSGLTGLVDRVEAIGGTIRVNSPAGEGTTIDVTLPIDL
jgi:signal transduction histidine kinase